MTLRTLNYGNYGIFLIMGHAGFCPSTVLQKNAAPKEHTTEKLEALPWDDWELLRPILGWSLCGSFRKLGVPYFGVLIMRDMGAIFGSPLFSETPI